MNENKVVKLLEEIRDSNQVIAILVFILTLITIVQGWGG